MKTIYILWLRQIKRYLRSKSRIFGALGQPILFLIALGYGLGPVFQKAGEGNYLQFLAPGIIGMSIIFTSVFSGIELIWDRQFGFLKETMVAPVSRFNIMLGRTIGGATVATFQGIIVFLISLIAGFRPTNFFLIFPAILVMFLIALLFTAIGTAIATQLEDMQGFQLIVNFLIMPVFFLSGAIFPLNNESPKVLVTIARFNPLSYGIDAMRSFLINTSHFGMLLNISVLLSTALFFILLGSYLFSKIEA
ncbi:MAG: ABC-2 type transporter [Candidatus Moranbacteria bacterium GW2011_GWF2_36_839]|nr:MAG: ABC-2 type transporter [Candidatus Moranbacteria bacterium GW2011_GWF1_36_78]KKQ17456.1 MAG: ABC-2 type transporter [Candidatus Moranbacteria bacterium GW2011_GWF2_36_839]HAT73923.1 multidrug ABC transporter permease [Candidatus Moranbacteria bacterium]HBY10551.1 multidrug ABC transporter permease [Candidatus Moranbacteria bacterium]